MIDLSFVRPIIEELYEGRARIEVKTTKKDPTTRATRAKNVLLTEDEPCRVSQRSEPTSNDRPLPSATEEVLLFIRPELEIPPGSHITVTQHGITREYASSGLPAVFCTHQEINLEIWEKGI